jgi:hypothetical protein
MQNNGQLSTVVAEACGWSMGLDTDALHRPPMQNNGQLSTVVAEACGWSMGPDTDALHRPPRTFVNDDSAQ